MKFKEVKDWFMNLNSDFDRIAVVEELLAVLDNLFEKDCGIDIDDIVESLTKGAERVNGETQRDIFYRELRRNI